MSDDKSAAKDQRELKLKPTLTNIYVEKTFYGRNKGKAVRIGWTDPRREPMLMQLMTWDSYNVLCLSKEGKRVMIPKHAIAFVIEEEPETETPDEETV